MKASAAGLFGPAGRGSFEVGVSTAVRWIAKAKDGEPTSRPQDWKRSSAPDAHEAFVIELIEERKDLTLDEMVALLSAERHVRFNHSAIGAWLRGRGWTFNKKSAPAPEQDRPDVLNRRSTWFDGQLDLDPKRLVFNDETGLSTNDGTSARTCTARRMLRAGVPHGHWKTATFTRTLRLTGMTAPAHMTSGVRDAIERVGARLMFLPPYSPDFNPIENAFSKLKLMLRARAERTIDTLWDAVGDLVHRFTPAECANTSSSRM